MTAKPKPAPKTRKTRSDAKGLKLVGVRLRPDQDQAILKAARARANELGRAVADKSEIVREAIDGWLQGRGGR